MNIFNLNSIQTKVIVIVFFSGLMVFNHPLQAQTINLIANAPTMQSYIGTPYIYNNQLTLDCSDGTNDILGIFDGNSISLKPAPINNLDGLTGIQNYAGDPLAYNNNLYMDYSALAKGAEYNQLGQYNNININMLSDSALGFDDSNGFGHIVYKNKLYFISLNRYSSGNINLMTYDGKNFERIQNPTPYGAINGFFKIYNNKLYFGYITYDQYYEITQNAELASYDGTSFTIYPNTSLGAFGTYEPFTQIPNPFTEYHNKLYFPYYTEGGNYTLAQFDGTNISLVSNPSGGSYSGTSIVYNDTLFLHIAVGNIGYLAKCDGTTISLVPNPNGSPGYSNYGYNSGTSVIYNNKLYISYENFGPFYQLAEYTGSGLKLIPNPDNGRGYVGEPLVFNNKLYFLYVTKSYGGHLGIFNGNDISLTPDVNSLGYFITLPFFINYQNTLYFNYAGHLAYLDEGNLPISLVNFTAQLKGEDAVLQWQTAQEQNTNYFNIQRSIDGTNFKSIDQIPAAGNSNTIKNYTSTDAGAAGLKAGKLFYRLQEVDKDGKSTYSKIVVVNFLNSLCFTISPNPVKDFINIVSGAEVNNALIKVTDMNGKTLSTIKESFTQGSRLQLPVGNLSKGVYMVTIETATNRSDYKIVKE